MKEEIIKITRKIEKQYCLATCLKCGKRVAGNSEGQLKQNMKAHKKSKSCQEFTSREDLE